MALAVVGAFALGFFAGAGVMARAIEKAIKTEKAP
jgi:hypothetical protein